MRERDPFNQGASLRQSPRAPKIDRQRSRSSHAEEQMDLAIWIMWGGVVTFFLIAGLLSDLDSMGMRPTSGRHDVADEAARPTALGGPKLLHTTRRGRAKIMVWRAEGSKTSDERYTLAVDRKDGECRDCMSCVNEAVQWMEHRGKLLRT
jgi:hypothetical protein